jgi:putative polyketide hydroxylase
MNVVIQGAGPSGCVAALLAVRCGFKVTLIDRQSADTFRGNAHYLNGYSLELLGQCGLDITTLLNHSTPDSYAHAMSYGCTLTDAYHYINLFDDESLRQRYQTTGRYGAAASIPFSRIYIELIALLKQKQVPILWNSEVTAVDLASHDVTVRSAQQTESVLKAEFLIGADGVTSGIRKLLFTEPQVTMHTNFVNVTLQSDLQTVVKRPALLNWILNPATPACFVMHEINGMQNCQIPLFETTPSAQEYTPEWAQQYVQSVVGSASVKVTIDSVQLWQMKTYTAKEMQREWVFLVGDSAHALTPAGGMGLNCALADAANLIWKLESYVNSGDATYVSSYSTERLPINKTCVEQSIANFLDFQSMAYRVGLPVNLASGVTAGLKKCPPALRQGVLGVSQAVYSFGLHAALKLPGVSQRIQRGLHQATEKSRLHFDGFRNHLHTVCRSDLVVAEDNGEVNEKMDAFFQPGKLAFLPGVLAVDDRKPLANRFVYGRWALLASHENTIEHLGMRTHAFVDYYILSEDFIMPDCPNPPEVILVRPDKVIAHIGSASSAVLLRFASCFLS